MRFQEIVVLLLRVLSGPVFGAEVAIPPGGCFVRTVDLGAEPVDPAVEQSMDALSTGAMLTIPLAERSPNFRLISSADTEGTERLYAELYDEDSGAVEQPVPLNTPVAIGGLWIAVRRADEAWSQAVSLYRGVGEPQAAALRPQERKAGWRRKVAGVAACAAGMASLAILVWTSWPAPAPAADVASLLATQTARSAQIVPGDKQNVYVFVDDQRVAGNIRRMLAQANISHVQIRIRAEEAARIGNWLEASGIRHFSVDLEDPRRPLLRLRQADEVKPTVPMDLDARLRNIAPYSRGMKVQWRSEKDAQRAARFLVEEVGAQATYRSTPDHFVATIDDHLSDAQLDTFSRALASYQRAWGREYARFQINQRDVSSIDGLKTGRLGYELRSARHIYFPPS
ncbi:PrgH/EprH family type III secretion apparatus protein [Achromobacter xylosoxidans]